MHLICVNSFKLLSLCNVSCFSPPDLSPGVGEKTHRCKPIKLSDSDAHGGEAGHMEPDPRPLGLHPVAPHRARQNLPHSEVPGGHEGRRDRPLGEKLLPQHGPEGSQQSVSRRRRPLWT